MKKENEKKVQRLQFIGKATVKDNLIQIRNKHLPSDYTVYNYFIYSDKIVMLKENDNKK